MAFDLPFTTPVKMTDADPWLGGPGSGGHQGTDWTQRYGNDYGCGGGREVRAAFDCVVKGDGWYPDLLDKVSKDGKKYGLQMKVASTGPGAGQVEAYYTHFNDIPADLKPGKALSRGDYIGKVREMPGAPQSTHLHFAMHENTPSGWKGVDMAPKLWDWAKDGSGHTIRFFGTGKAPEPDPAPSAPAAPTTPEGKRTDVGPDILESQETPAQTTAMGSGCEGAGSDTTAEPATAQEEVALLSRKVLARTPAEVLRLQRAVGNRGIGSALRSSPERLAALAPQLEPSPAPEAEALPEAVETRAR